ncbi:hypothetical protein [Methylococcus sp. EFPC2]|uniref:hypothetical protein n=1 Tax=Methylococcus sp. EFPC2 TaxID=2812648 RepID=UPI0019672D0C|nr:hypothetical protein [Methylococcus sp. EFPC2]QSA97504.1 hypothetical protein JWZ97_01250 [Methylococcus sp. EFPC2]
MTGDTRKPPDDKIVIVPLDPRRRKAKDNKRSSEHWGTRYKIHEGRICRVQKQEPNDLLFPLCNFAARIAAQVEYDDGEETPELRFAIEAQLAGRTFPVFDVTAADFAGLGWVTARLGAAAIVYAGQGTKDHLRCAIQELSPEFGRRTIYSHTGWRRIDEQWRYLHAGGAIGAEDVREDVEVEPGRGHMALYRLPAPPDGEALSEAVRASLALFDLCPQRPEVGALLLALIYRAATAHIVAVDHGGWLEGTTGCFKSELAALAMAHFGAFSARALPGAWVDTETDLEQKAHAAKDALFVVDDFKPIGTATDISRLHTKADHLHRSAGNQSGRGRRTTDLKQRPAYHPRGVILSTGEDLPAGESLRARLAIVRLRKGDVDRAALSQMQRHAANGLLAKSMAGFIRWLAKRFEALRDELPAGIQKTREAILQEHAYSHARTASDTASLVHGLHLLEQYAIATGAITAAEGFFDRSTAALMELMQRQGETQTEENEVTRFFDLLRSALTSGLCYVADRITQGPPVDHPHAWGWSTVVDDEGNKTPHPKGRVCIGWTNGVDLWLDGNAAFKVVQEFARGQGTLIPVGKGTLWKRIYEQDLLISTTVDAKQPRLAIKQWIGGVGIWVYHLNVNALEG